MAYDAADAGPFPFTPPFIVGADISWTLQDEAAGATYSDSTGKKPPEQIMAENGFNFIRLRTFVDPQAAGGYSRQGFCDTAQTVLMTKRVKNCGMGVFVDFHMSDTWSSLGSQPMPSAWTALSQVVPSTPVSKNTTGSTIYQAAHDYVASVMQALVAGGVKPDMVQIGNETSSGMSGIDMSNWPAFSALVNAGITAVRETDPSIIVWAQNGRPRDAAFGTWVDDYLSDKAPHVPAIDEDGICGSTYGTTTTPAGDDWKQWFGYVVTTYDKPVMSCEYTDSAPDDDGGQVINMVMAGLPKNMGRGSFNWEPTRGSSKQSNLLFNSNNADSEGQFGNQYTVNANMAAYVTLARSHGMPVPSGTCTDRFNTGTVYVK
jgi:arabinogalactan endo-1,4-beta-galactosidase